MNTILIFGAGCVIGLVSGGWAGFVFGTRMAAEVVNEAIKGGKLIPLNKGGTNDLRRWRPFGGELDRPAAPLPIDRAVS